MRPLRWPYFLVAFESGGEQRLAAQVLRRPIVDTARSSLTSIRIDARCPVWHGNATARATRPGVGSNVSIARANQAALYTLEPMDLTRFARRRYTEGPTPLEPLPRFSEWLGGPEIWIKRDDLLGLAPGGNKTRKLEFLAADALAQDADTLVTCGAPQSNHCRITLAAAVKEGLRCRFVIEERVPKSYRLDASGNNFLFRLLGVEAITVVPGGTDMAAAMQKVAAELAAEGRKAYIIPGGGSNALGGLGYVACAQELQQQWFERELHFDHLVVGSGSSGTHGGLLAGFLGNRIDMPITGIGVSRDPADQEPLVHREAQAVADLLGLGMTIPREAVVSVGGYWQPKYSVPNAKMVEAVQALARTEAILLDPVYTGKVMAGPLSVNRVKRVHDFLIKNNISVLDNYELKGFGEDFKQSKVQAANRKVTIFYQKKTLAGASIINSIEKKSLGEKVKAGKVGDIFILDNIYFRNRSPVIVTKSKPVLYDLLCVMEENPTVKIEIRGHICCQLLADVEDISTLRAKGVYNFLIRNKINRKRLSYKGFGNTLPIHPIPEKNDLEADENRRVEIKIVEY